MRQNQSTSLIVIRVVALNDQFLVDEAGDPGLTQFTAEAGLLDTTEFQFWQGAEEGVDEDHTRFDARG